jgi:hypothetical protein
MRSQLSARRSRGSRQIGAFMQIKGPLAVRERLGRGGPIRPASIVDGLFEFVHVNRDIGGEAKGVC